MNADGDRLGVSVCITSSTPLRTSSGALWWLWHEKPWSEQLASTSLLPSHTALFSTQCPVTLLPLYLHWILILQKRPRHLLFSKGPLLIIRGHSLNFLPSLNFTLTRQYLFTIPCPLFPVFCKFYTSSCRLFMLDLLSYFFLKCQMYFLLQLNWMILAFKICIVTSL